MRLISFVLLASVAQADPLTVRVTGAVHASESFQRRIGRGLAFEIRPDGSDWRLGVYPAGEGGNLADCVSEPLHGPNVLDVMAWNYAKSDHDTRGFEFTLTAADRKAVCKNWSLMADGVREGSPMLGDPQFRMPKLGRCRLRVRKVKLGGGSADRIEGFEVDARFAIP